MEILENKELLECERETEKIIKNSYESDEWLPERDLTRSEREELRFDFLNDPSNNDELLREYETYLKLEFPDSHSIIERGSA